MSGEVSTVQTVYVCVCVCVHILNMYYIYIYILYNIHCTYKTIYLL